MAEIVQSRGEPVKSPPAEDPAAQPLSDETAVSEQGMPGAADVRGVFQGVKDGDRVRERRIDRQVALYGLLPREDRPTTTRRWRDIPGPFTRRCSRGWEKCQRARTGGRLTRTPRAGGPCESIA